VTWQAIHFTDPLWTTFSRTSLTRESQRRRIGKDIVRCNRDKFESLTEPLRTVSEPWRPLPRTR